MATRTLSCSSRFLNGECGCNSFGDCNNFCFCDENRVFTRAPIEVIVFIAVVILALPMTQRFTKRQFCSVKPTLSSRLGLLKLSLLERRQSETKSKEEKEEQADGNC
jgi:hypothetical protein